MGIPETLLNDISRIPRDRPVTVLMRHSARFPIIPPDDGFNVPLTSQGVRMAEELGELLAPEFSGGRLRASPVGRCIATAEAIARGACWAGSVLADDRISHPFHEPCWNLVSSGGLNGELPEPVRAAVGMLLEPDGAKPHLDVMVTHDTVLGSVVGGLLRAPVLREHWPNYLEGVFFWRDGAQICALWRGEEYRYDEELRRCA